MEVALEAGADDLRLIDGFYEVTCDPRVFEPVRQALEAARVPVESAETGYIPTTTVDLDADNAKRMQKLLDILDENEDVQNVYSNENTPEAAMA